jgi:hypothetical protein
VYAVDLFERRADRPVSLQLRRHVDGPELRADAARAQPGQVGVQAAGLVGGDVTPVEVVPGQLPQRPREVVVPVHHGVAGEQRVGTFQSVGIGGVRHLRPH